MLSLHGRADRIEIISLASFPLALNPGFRLKDGTNLSGMVPQCYCESNILVVPLERQSPREFSER